MTSLADIPFYGVYKEVSERNRQAGLEEQSQQLKQVGLLAQLQAQMVAQQEKQRAAQKAATYDAEIAAAAGDPVKLRDIAMRRGLPADILRATQPDKPLADTRPEVLKLTEVLEGLAPNHPARPFIISRLEGLGAKPVKDQNPSNLARLRAEQAALDPNDKAGQAYYANALRKESETAKQISPTIVMPKTDRVPLGYRMKPDGSMEAIPGGPADTKIQGALNQDTSSLNESQSGMDRLQAEANRLLNHPGLSKTTGLMSIVPLAGGLATVPGTEAANFKAGLENLKSQVGFSVLQQMRNNSKTGGALGQISDRENILLQNNLAALDRAQSEQEFKAALGRIVEYTEGAKGRLRNAYNIKHGGRQAPQVQPSTETRKFATEAEAIASGVKGDVVIGGRKARID